MCSVLDPAGGLERCVQLWAKELLKYCTVTLIDLAETSVSAIFDPDREKINYVPCPDIGRLPQLLSDLKIDAVHLQNRPLLETGIPTLVTFHNYPYAWSQNPHIDKRLLQNALADRYITAVSQALLEESLAFIGNEKTKSFLLRPPVAKEFFDKKHLGGNGLLFASRLMRKKGVEIAVRSVRLAGIAGKSGFLDTTTPFLQKSSEYSEMKRLIAEAGIKLLPPAKGAGEMAEYYSKADLVLQISLENEGLGLIPLEAQAVGANVIAAGPGGLAETIFGSNRYLAETSPDKIADAAAELLADPSPGTPPGLKEYDPAVSGQKLFSVIEDMLSKKR